MAGVLDKIRKRAKYPVTLSSGEKIEIRTMTIGEHVRVGALPNDMKIGFMIGCVILEDDGRRAIPQNEGESDLDFSMRVVKECDIDVPDALLIKEALDKLDKPVPQKVIAKNSEETSTQD